MPGQSMAALKAFSPNPATLNGVVLGGMPAWFQDQSGVAVAPCLDVVSCGLIGLGDPNFNELQPLAYPNNFPSEAFYALSNTNDFSMGVNGGTASIVLGLEFTFVDPLTGALTSPRTPGALTVPFQRQRIIQVFPAGTPAPAAGSWTLTTPWGTTTFDVAGARCQNQAGGTKCTATQDLPLPGAVPPNFNAALGTGVPGSMSTFIKDPLAPANFLGTATATLSAVDTTGALVNIALRDPLGNTGNVGTFNTIVGKTVGLEALPASQNLGVTVVNTPSPGKTFTVSNLTGAPVALTLASSNPFFLFPAGTDNCSATPAAPTLAVGASCTFDVALNAAAAGPASTTITISAPGAPTATVTASGIGDAIHPTLAVAPVNFVNTANPTVSGTVSDDHGISSVTVSVNGGAPQNAAVANGTWTLANLVLPGAPPADGVYNLSVVASDVALPAPGNQTTVNTSLTLDRIAPTVSINPLAAATTNLSSQPISGTATDGNGIGTLTVNVNGSPQGVATVDSLGNFSFTVNNLTPNALSSITAIATDPAGNKTTSAPVSVTFLAPRDGDINLDGAVDVSDALMALRTSVGLVNPSAEQRVHGDVSPMSAVSPIVPVGDGSNDVADALLILRKVVKLVNF